jgi:Ni,Fe-hydrogenase maturation factor
MNEWEWQLLEETAPVESVPVGGVDVRKGDLVRLHPRQGGDIFDLALAGQVAIVESIEQDYEGKVHLAVVLEEDPGKDLGVLRQPGHRFFFAPEECEALGPVPARTATSNSKILIAGIGNIFLGDDGFGVEVARRLSEFDFPGGVRVQDFGIRGYDLAYALLDGYDLTILVDAAPRGSAPGTLYVIEPEINQETGALTSGAGAGRGELAGESACPTLGLDAHAMNPVSVLQFARSMGSISGKVLLVGCEPATLGGEEGHMGLCEPVAAAVDQAVKLVRKLVTEHLDSEKG